MIDLEPGRPRPRSSASLHASALAVSPDRRYVVCANAASDTLSVIDTRDGRRRRDDLGQAEPGRPLRRLAERPGLRSRREASSTSPTARRTPWPSSPSSRRSRASEFLGLIPVGWFPGAIALSSRGSTALSSPTSRASRRSGGRTRRRGPGHGFQLPPVPRLAVARPRPRCRRAAAAHGRPSGRTTTGSSSRGRSCPPRPGQPPRPVPERIGEPSVFKHVVYIIKENRTYDQVLGDIREGNGDPSLCHLRRARHAQPAQAGPRFRPARQHLLLRHPQRRRPPVVDDRPSPRTTWRSPSPAGRAAIRTAWATTRSTPWPTPRPASSGTTPSRHGKTLRDYGEFAMPDVRWADPDSARTTPIGLACWREYNAADRARSSSAASRPSSRCGRISPRTPSAGAWRSRRLPGRPRSSRSSRNSRRTGRSPTSSSSACPTTTPAAPRKALPTPAAYVADNDLAFGRIVEAISRSRFWKETVIFAIEDDPQDGWDHVSGYRTTAYVVSPYTKRGAGRQHAIQHDQHPADDRADPRPAADEPVRRRRHADVRLLHGDARFHAVHRRAEPRPPRRDEPARRRRSPIPCSGTTPRSRPGSTSTGSTPAPRTSSTASSGTP